MANSLLAGGVIVRGADVTNSVLSSCVQVSEGSTVDQAVVLPGAHIGAGCHLRRAIIDAETRIPDGTVIAPKSGVTLLSGVAMSAESAGGLRSVA
jgi:glucose-1-phosphate adenylyltransferase